MTQNLRQEEGEKERKGEREKEIGRMKDDDDHRYSTFESSRSRYSMIVVAADKDEKSKAQQSISIKAMKDVR